MNKNQNKNQHKKNKNDNQTFQNVYISLESFGMSRNTANLLRNIPIFLDFTIKMFMFIRIGNRGNLVYESKKDRFRITPKIF